MKLSRRHAFLLALMGSVALSACGEKGSAPEATSTKAATPAAVETAAPEPAEIPAPASEASEPTTPQTSEPEPTPAPEVTSAPAHDSASASPDDNNPFASLPAPYNTADYDQGRRQFTKCRSCHLIDEGAGHRVGPNLYGVFDRKIGELEDFKYSKAAQEAQFDWSSEKLDQWLASPKEFLPGNRMTFAGIANEEQRTNLIAYLLVETSK